MHRTQPDFGVGLVVVIVAAATRLSFNANDDRFAENNHASIGNMVGSGGKMRKKRLEMG